MKKRTKSCFVFAIIVTAALGMGLLTGFADEAQEVQVLPDWIFGSSEPIPNWLYGVEELPDWFYDLPSEPIWFRQIDRIPSWFYTITEIPDWFYPVSEEEEPEEDNIFEPEFEMPEFEPVPESTLYHFPYGSGDMLITNIPNGMITSREVFLNFEPGTLGIEQNGFFISYLLGEAIIENGVYRLVLAADFVTEIFTFTIAAEPVNSLTVYNAPDGFTIVEVLLAGRQQQIPDNRSFDMREDGDYEFTIADAEFETVFTVSITLDTAPPVLTFYNVSAEGEQTELVWPEDGSDAFIGPIAYHSDEIYDISLQILYNRAEINPPHNRILREAGRYHITAVDAAGNSVQYTFRILYVMDVPTGWVIAVSSILIVGLTTYLIYNRKKVRVR
ncbi:MAG: hypothetical protein LBC86_00305 [Oscillospiraceae bacterium]|nr:hypothetical protein [Oscillospiraceae bacterium]